LGHIHLVGHKMIMLFRFKAELAVQ